MENPNQAPLSEQGEEEITDSREFRKLVRYSRRIMKMSGRRAMMYKNAFFTLDEALKRGVIESEEQFKPVHVDASAKDVDVEIRGTTFRNIDFSFLLKGHGADVKDSLGMIHFNGGPVERAYYLKTDGTVMAARGRDHEWTGRYQLNQGEIAEVVLALEDAKFQLEEREVGRFAIAA
jgi:hypothetical protein